MSEIKTLARGIALLECLMPSEAWEGKTREELAAAAGIPAQTVWRLLKSLEKLGWVDAMAPNKAGQAKYRIGAKKMIETAVNYKRYMIGARQALENTYFETTGEKLDD